MNIIDFITRNDFLKKLYPDGLPNKLIIGRIELLDEDRVYIHIKTTQKPCIDVAKWGCWDKDYNIVSIELTGQFIKEINILNWKGTQDFFELSVTNENGLFNINLINSESKISFLLGGIVFQGCSVFLIEN